MFEFSIKVLQNELWLQQQDYYSYSEKKNQDQSMRNQIELEAAIKILKEVNK